MSKVMIFNPSNLEQREVSHQDAERAEREHGWVRVGGANELLAIFHPQQRDQKMILKRDLPIWESKGYYAEPTVLYHPERGDTIVPGSRVEEYLSQGWYDSPAAFPQAAQDAVVEKAVKNMKAAKA